MPICSKCDKNKPSHEFAKKGNGRQPWCRPCNRDYARAYYKANPKQAVERAMRNNALRRAESQTFIDELKSAPCKDCGKTFPPCAMDFDHLPGMPKVASLSNLVRHAYSRERIEKELAKCELVCAVCHRIRTAARFES